jgi:hypothetical protein
MKRESLLIIQRFVDTGDTESVQFLRGRFAAWISNKGTLPLNQALGVPATAAALGIQTRDAWLRYAANALPPDAEVGTKGAILCAAVSKFMTRKWPELCRQNSAPENLDYIERALFFAAKATQESRLYAPLKCKMPESRQQYVNILSE